jgi:hypothetical protein
MGEEQLDVFVGFRLLVFGSAGSRLTCLAVHWIGWFSPSCLLYVWLLLALGMFVLCFFSMGACSRFRLGYWLPSSLYILFLFATFVALLPLILIYSYIWSKKKRHPETPVKFRSRSNGRIKSYCLYEPLLLSGATRPPPHRVWIPHPLYEKRTSGNSTKILIPIQRSDL